MKSETIKKEPKKKLYLRKTQSMMTPRMPAHKKVLEAKTKRNLMTWHE
jgi:hypothetical protein